MTSQDQFGDINVPGPQAPATPGRSTYQFSNEELQVLHECNRDSFFQRCLPIGTLLGLAAYYGVQAGHLKPSPKWGPTPKVIVASIIGYFIGKISYQAKCAEKLMQLPDSRLGALLRQKKRGGGFKESLDPGYGPGVSLSPFSGLNPSDTYSDVDPSNNIDIDTSRPPQSELDDSMRPSMDNNPVFEDETMPPMQDKTTTYEELRKKNREDYQKQRTNFRTSDDSTTRTAPKSGEEKDRFTSSSKRTNIYGDPME